MYLGEKGSTSFVSKNSKNARTGCGIGGGIGKVCSDLKWLGSALSAFSSNAEVLNSNIFGPSAPTMMGASRDTKTSDFRYKRYPKKINGYVTVYYTLPVETENL